MVYIYRKFNKKFKPKDSFVFVSPTTGMVLKTQLSWDDLVKTNIIESTIWYINPYSLSIHFADMISETDPWEKFSKKKNKDFSSSNYFIFASAAKVLDFF